jgi:hypothetical protein
MVLIRAWITCLQFIFTHSIYTCDTYVYQFIYDTVKSLKYRLCVGAFEFIRFSIICTSSIIYTLNK